MIGLVMVSRAPQTRINLGGLDVPAQNIDTIKTLTISGVMVPTDTFIPCKLEGNDYTVPDGKLFLMGKSLSVSGKDAFQLGHAADISGTNFIPIIGEAIFSQGSSQVAILVLLTTIKEGRVIGCLSVKPNMNTAVTLYGVEVFNNSLENQAINII